MADAAIKRVMVDEGHVVSQAIATMHQRRSGEGAIRTKRDFAEVLHYSSLTAWTDGIELGLAIAVRDVAAGRRLLEWIRRDMLDNDADALANTESSVDHFMAVLDR